MAIRDIITIGFGNGTFSPGVNKIPTLGYATAVVLPPDKGGWDFVLPGNRSHFIIDDNKGHFVLADNRFHFDSENPQ